MKTLLLIVAFTLLVGCAPQAHSPTVLVYSHEFQIPLSHHLVSGAKVFNWDELGVKTAAGKVFAGQIVSNEKEKLPEGFDIRQYPEYLLKIKPTTNLDDATAKLFDNSASELDYSYGLKSLETKQIEDRTIYSLCKKDDCLAMMVKASVTEHILYVHTEGIGRTEFVEILSGVLDANK
jgi:hypothetical protein